MQRNTDAIVSSSVQSNHPRSSLIRLPVLPPPSAAVHQASTHAAESPGGVEAANHSHGKALSGQELLRWAMSYDAGNRVASSSKPAHANVVMGDKASLRLSSESEDGCGREKNFSFANLRSSSSHTDDSSSGVFFAKFIEVVFLDRRFTDEGAAHAVTISTKSQASFCHPRRYQRTCFGPDDADVGYYLAGTVCCLNLCRRLLVLRQVRR